MKKVYLVKTNGTKESWTPDDEVDHIFDHLFKVDGDDDADEAYRVFDHLFDVDEDSSSDERDFD